MAEVLDTSRFELPPAALIGSFELDHDGMSRSQLLDKIREGVRAGQETQGQWASAFDELYQDALKGDFSAPFLMRWSAALLERQKGALERLHPFLEEIQKQLLGLRRADLEFLELYKDMIDFIFGWITPYQKLSGQLLDLALARRAESAKVLRAKSAMNEVDQKALTGEIIARFPKILAALAK